MNLNTIQQDIAELPPEAQQIVLDLVDRLKKRYVTDLPEATTDWSDFIGCLEAESDLSRNYKTYLSRELGKKYDHR
jgi:hypothetical protein